MEKLVLAGVFAIPCGLLGLSAGFVVSRFETRRARIEAEIRQTVHQPDGPHR